MKSKYAYNEDDKFEVGSALVIQNIAMGTPRTKKIKGQKDSRVSPTKGKFYFILFLGINYIQTKLPEVEGKAIDNELKKF